MAERLTDQQRAAVENRGGEILVSAAAGSGKTKVLVERLLSYVMDPVNPANIDDFLIITYTKAAASELRGKIGKALTDRITQDPTNQRLQNQFQRLYLAKISTVHSFCSDIIREYAYLLDISGDFRMAEESECDPIRLQLVDKLLEDAYDQISTDSDLQAFVDTQGVGRNDRQVPELILKVYDSARCHKDPAGWIKNCLNDADVQNLNDPLDTIWGKYIVSELYESIAMHCSAMEKMAALCDNSEGLSKMAEFLRDIVFQLQRIRQATSWDEIHRLQKPDYHNLTCMNRVKKDKEVYEMAKSVREACMNDMEVRLRPFGNESKQVLEDLLQTLPAVRGLTGLVQKFSDTYDKTKKALHIADFSDLEHKALDLLLGKSRSGVTSAAKEIGSRFREIMVDEYQDSNEVQDAIFAALTSEQNNLFMVGDVKQSIYQFRMADPSIFIGKYDRYLHYNDAKAGEGRRIILSNNFRSCDSVIEAVNWVFDSCMSEKVGGMVYGSDEALFPGREYIPVTEKEVELHVLSTAEDVYAEEAEYVAERISQLLDGSHMIRNGDTLRPIRPEDIVILLRSPKTSGWEFHYALQRRGYKTVSSNAPDLLETEEVEWLRSFLQTINNPHQDIPLIATLAGPVFGFTADELAHLRSGKFNCNFYDALRNSDTAKAKQFMDVFHRLRKIARTHTLPELVESIFHRTQADAVYAAMKDGAERSANLKDFYQFIVRFNASGKSDLQQLLLFLQQCEHKGLETNRENMSDGCIQITSIHKSKGLEYPVVFLCGLSRAFNMASSRGNLLCDQHLGLGLNCVDDKNRVRYPSLSKYAISAKIKADSISEELRVLYVAMTRPKDRLIMTYAQKNSEKKLAQIVARMDVSQRELITGSADNPGAWILYSALKRTEAGELFAKAGKPIETTVSKQPWAITFQETHPVTHDEVLCEVSEIPELPPHAIENLSKSLDLHYKYETATITPSKQTATQRKGRLKDQEVAENAPQPRSAIFKWRKPSFVQLETDGREIGNAMHLAMQHISFAKCGDLSSVVDEIQRLVDDGVLASDQAELIDCRQLSAFFLTNLGKKICAAENVMREFKFSILENADPTDPVLAEEKILLQGVVDCVLIEPDGITVVDFKTDHVSEDSVSFITERYRQQVEIYASAMQRIFKMPIKGKALYYFSLGEFVWL